MSKINIGIKILNFIIFLMIVVVFLIFPIMKFKNLPQMFFSTPTAKNPQIDNSLFERLDKEIENYLK